MSDLEIRAVSAPWHSGVDLLVREGAFVAQPVTLEKIKPSSIVPPTLTIENKQAQVLMDDLWAAGFRPSEGSGSAGSLAATERHLADMRAIAFDQLGVEGGVMASVQGRFDAVFQQTLSSIRQAFPDWIVSVSNRSNFEGLSIKLTLKADENVVLERTFSNGELFNMRSPEGLASAFIEAARKEIDSTDREVENFKPSPGDYVLATKWDDGDPGDPWALGFYDGERNGRHFVVDVDGKQIRVGGYRRVCKIRKDVGAWLLEVAAEALEASPPGTVNLWTMLTRLAFDQSRDKPLSDPP